MSFLQQNNLRLGARNEGKIKTYESCCDIRAWSHDWRVQDRYLREWMKADMPICVIPTSTLSSFLRRMTCKSCRRATPHCHPDCKSKELLESICISCHAVKDCLLQDENFKKYFIEEELETSHWPCDRCLEALKSIKMFWKIIVDKIFNINFSKYDTFESKCEVTNNQNQTRSVTKVWQSEIVQQAMIVANVKPGLRRACNLFRFRTPIQEATKQPRRIIISNPIENIDDLRNICNSNSCTVKSQHSLLTEKKLSKTTSISMKMNDVGCDTCRLEEDSEEVNSYKKNLKALREKYSLQNKEMDSLREENNSLKVKLENVNKSCRCRKSLYVTDHPSAKAHILTTIPKAFEENIDDNSSVKNIDSEMIITMKKCKNESFRHVSYLQVLHKTNDPIRKNFKGNGQCNKKEDPIEILNKVQNTFGAIVKREMSIVNERRHRPKRTEVDAAFHRISASISAPSCSTISSCLSSEADFVSTKDSDKNNINIINI